MTGRTVLVVDDDAGVRRGIRGFLEAHGYRVEEAESCAGAERAFSTRPPDAAILDLQLPDGSGTDLVPRLKSVAPEVPLIILTGHGSIEAAVKAIKQGAEQFLTKPVEMPAVLVLLDRLLQNQRDHRSRLAGNSQKARAEIDPFQGASPALERLAEECRRIRGSESPPAAGHFEKCALLEDQEARPEAVQDLDVHSNFWTRIDIRLKIEPHNMVLKKDLRSQRRLARALQMQPT